MGLDMFLESDWHIGANWEHNEISGAMAVFKEGNLLPLSLNNVVTITEQVAYWRKANAIHGWFVKNVQDGNDDCNRYYVGKEQLQQLHDVCLGVLLKELEPSVVLPTMGGFFFGSAEYDEYYYEQLQYTVDVIDGWLKRLIEAEDMGAIVMTYYQSNW